MKLENLVRSTLLDIPKTVHGGTAWKLEGIEDFSHNLNPLGPPLQLSDIINGAVDELGHYPDDSCKLLKEAISNHFQVEPENIIVGSGSSDLIRLFPNVFLNGGDRVLMPRPTFAEYSQQCAIVGAKINDLLLMDTDDFRVDEERLLLRLTPSTKAVYLCNPNNPTGRIEPRDKILAIVKECRKKDVLVFLDETLLELVEGHQNITCVPFIKDYDNLFIASSLTKSFAIPGIRIGFGFGGKEIISYMEKARMTWNVGSIEQHVATVLLRDHINHVNKAARLMKEESKWIFSELKKVGLPLSRLSDSYFYFTSLQSLKTNGKEFQERMIYEGIMIRDCASFGRPFDRFIRFCVKDRQRNSLFVHSVHDALRSLER